ncbi:MAG: hypothetical protein E7434_05145 [Ruminococcaceae bacterium]|nr:hypothetical protein [Oscillospiraceae bacterium]
MNVFEKALLQSVNDDFYDVPAEEDLDLPTVNPKNVCTAHIFRRTLIIAAAIIALAGSVFAAYVLTYQIGDVEVVTNKDEIFDFEISENDTNRYYQLTFKENFANPNAPEKIETYFLPTKDVSPDTLSANCYIEQKDFHAYYPFMTEQPLGFVLTQAEVAQILNSPTTVHYEWCGESEQQIIFTQSLAIVAADGTAYVTHAVNDTDTINSSYQIIQVDEYSVFSFEHDWSEHPDWLDPLNTVSRTWYWTDGDYLFTLSATVSVDEMTELFRSIKPVSTQFPYRQTDELRYEESFDLPQSLD